jgi:PadR family transcriptional regulator, regulatory protein AphA
MTATSYSESEYIATAPNQSRIQAVKSNAAEATTTRFAILGQLALRKWSAYELTKSMGRTLAWFWPRAESVIYAEARRLVADGLASSREEPAADGSSRKRTVYAITSQGKRLLADWLATEPTTLQLALEPLLRIHLARFGTREDLLRAVAFTESRADDLLDVAEEVAAEFASGAHILQKDAHFRALIFHALWGIGIALRDTARKADAEIRRWESVTGDDDARARGVAAMVRAVRARGARRKTNAPAP